MVAYKGNVLPKIDTATCSLLCNINSCLILVSFTGCNQSFIIFIKFH